ncbi:MULTISPECIES: hypothetical protein [Pseudomonas syringae group]|uniref:hypothetical protein n=1 Tax=Pseudomonas syringae group TaxID=136849 RepID=UPI000B14A741|nr:hypothetical protein [Pseudomonas coronafaciens]
MKLPKTLNVIVKLESPLLALVRKTILNLKEIAESTTPVSGLMALVSITLIAYTTNLIFIISTYPHSAGVIFMLGFASVVVSIIVALDLVGNHERFKSIDAYIESEINKQTQENNGK